MALLFASKFLINCICEKKNPEQNAYFTKPVLYVYTAIQLVSYGEKIMLCEQTYLLIKAFNLYLYLS